jgi:hypothetical protein
MEIDGGQVHILDILTLGKKNMPWCPANRKLGGFQIWSGLVAK